MDLRRRGTVFEPPSIRGVTPDSHDDESIGTDSHPVASGYFSNKLKKRAWAAENDEPPPRIRGQSESKDQEEVRQGLSRFTPQMMPSKVRPGETVKVQHSSPWRSFTKQFTLSLEDSVTIATRKGGLFVAVREFSGPDADQKVNMLQRVRKDNPTNLLAFLECFSFEGSHFAVFEHEIIRGEKLAVTLSHYALIQNDITESQLAFILRQILDGLKYLASIGFEHSALTCKNILISTEGSIRIAGQECCQKLESKRGPVRDIRGVGYVAMELMHKDAKYEGPIKVRDVSRWPLDSEAVKFLLLTATACSIEELEKRGPLLDTYSNPARM
ncbi:hypothetical protein DL98DRAFT_619281 [Cadophora sp. DSE1049]|nr:hypothetical protein DL98DRAFT_619281 [Cadophora sp. DSE1049]